MIIGNNNNNNNFNNNNFENKFKKYQDNTQNHTGNIFVKDIKQHVYGDPTSSNDMNDKALAMLNERLQNGLITLEEFNKKCQEIATRRKN